MIFILGSKQQVALGYIWIREHLYSCALYHHGIKGQKWGIRNGPPYPLENSEKSGIIEEAIQSGKVKREMNPEKQMRHTKSYHTEGRSYLDGDLDYAERLINELSGTGEALTDRNGIWNHKEKVINPDEIGTNVDQYTGEETRTNVGIISYSKTGTHIYPTSNKKGNK
jgi:hypothetical protein